MMSFRCLKFDLANVTEQIDAILLCNFHKFREVKESLFQKWRHLVLVNV